jgi:hypothetical protein
VLHRTRAVCCPADHPPRTRDALILMHAVGL